MWQQFYTVGQKNGYLHPYLNHRLKAGHLMKTWFIYHGHMVVPIALNVAVLGVNLEYVHYTLDTC